MVFKPVNRHILVDYIPPESKPQSGILLPDDYVAPTEDYITVGVHAWADDVSIPVCHEGAKIIIDKKMLQKITVEHSNYYLILENYVIGVIH
jgi:co-chaperonin GroES (HSP10)|tara:strand:+ start:978 stop:1253 length:276 start_codon:yes stop_codon:yes gene_type:complete